MAPIQRSQVPDEQVWNLTDMFSDEEAFAEAIQQLKAAKEALSGHDKSLSQSESEFLSFLQTRDEVMAQALRVLSYTNLKFSEDGNDAHSQELVYRAQSAWQGVFEELTRLQSICLNLPDGMLEHFAAATDLSIYREYINELVHAREHKLSPEAEAALAAVSETLTAPPDIYRAATGGDLHCGTVDDERGEEFLVTPFSVMLRSETSYDFAFRQRAYDALISGLRPYHNVLGTTLSTEIKKNVALARLRGYSSTAEMLLHEGNLDSPSDDVPVSFFERVPELILKELAPHMQRYARLRAQVWGLKKLRFCDIKAPIVNTSAEKLEFAVAENMITEAVAVMGQEYQKVVKRAFKDQWIYRGDNVGALQGAYCAPVPGMHPYVFHPYHGILYDTFTLCHELGHAAHMVYAQANNVQQNTSSSRLFVEAPSTFHEHLLGHYLRTTGGTEIQMQTACVQLFTFHHNFVTHLIEGELLRRIYRLADAGEPVTTGVLDETQMEILQDFWGDTVELDEGAGLTWMRQPHYYAGLYPYTYSVGLTASTALAVRLENGEDVAQQWIDVLKLGGSQHALELFRTAGIDLNSEQPYHDAVSYAGHLIDLLAGELA